MPAKPARLVALALALTLAAPVASVASAHLKCATEHHECAGRDVMACCCHSVAADASVVKAIVQTFPALPLSPTLEPLHNHGERAIVLVTGVRAPMFPTGIPHRDLPTLFSVLLL